MEEPLILITNDDGITAPGIKCLVEVAKTFSNNLVVVAPDKPQSGMGHAITMNATLRASKTELLGVEAYACSGTPVDCVKLAVSAIIKQKPDIILSGVNHGSNSSINVIYSGTMSAAVEGAIEGIPAVGFSLCDHSIDADFEPTKPYITRVVRYILENGIADGTCLNVNFPAIESSLIRGLKVCRQANAMWEEEFDERSDPSGNPYYWLTGRFVNHEEESEDTDEWALKHNYVSVVPVQIDITAHAEVPKLKTLENV